MYSQERYEITVITKKPLKEEQRMKRRRISEENLDMLNTMSEDLVEEDVMDENLPDNDIASDEDELIDEIDSLDADDETEDLEADADLDDETVEASKLFSDEDDVDDLEAGDDLEDEWADDEDVTTASEEIPGIEDDITDTGIGGDPTVQEVTDKGEGAKNEVSKDSEVFPTESEYVASIVRRLDRVAGYLEKSGKKHLAYRVDRVSDALEAKLKR